MLNRAAPGLAATLALTAIEIGSSIASSTKTKSRRQKTLSYYLIKLARLGGYFARANDPPPGNTVMWRGVSRLTDIELGFIIEARICG